MSASPASLIADAEDILLTRTVLSADWAHRLARAVQKARSWDASTSLSDDAFRALAAMLCSANPGSNEAERLSQVIVFPSLASPWPASRHRFVAASTRSENQCTATDTLVQSPQVVAADLAPISSRHFSLPCMDQTWAAEPPHQRDRPFPKHSSESWQRARPEAEHTLQALYPKSYLQDLMQQHSAASSLASFKALRCIVCTGRTARRTSRQS